jgi:SAM-dependent methyltransferase
MVDDNTTRTHFSRIAKIYHQVRTTDEAPIRFIRDDLDGLASVTAADFGCGAGRYDLLLHRYLPNLHLTCIDSNEDMLAELSRYLSSHGICDYRVVASRVEDLDLDDGSFDCVVSLNAVHHFHFPTFLQRAGRTLVPGGRIFIYTRTPEENSRTIWGRYFPGFLARETRIYPLADMEGWIAASAGLDLVRVKRFRYSRLATLGRLLGQARGKNYSTFSLYSPEEFDAALKAFEDNIRSAFSDLDHITWRDENIMLTVERGDNLA